MSSHSITDSLNLDYIYRTLTDFKPLDKKGRPVYLKVNFEVTTKLAGRATFQQLLERVKCSFVDSIDPQRKEKIDKVFDKLLIIHSSQKDEVIPHLKPAKVFVDTTYLTQTLHRIYGLHLLKKMFYHSSRMLYYQSPLKEFNRKIDQGYYSSVVSVSTTPTGINISDKDFKKFCLDIHLLLNDSRGIAFLARYPRFSQDFDLKNTSGEDIEILLKTLVDMVAERTPTEILQADFFASCLIKNVCIQATEVMNTSFEAIYKDKPIWLFLDRTIPSFRTLLPTLLSEDSHSQVSKELLQSILKDELRINPLYELLYTGYQKFQAKYYQIEPDSPIIYKDGDTSTFSLPLPSDFARLPFWFSEKPTLPPPTPSSPESAPSDEKKEEKKASSKKSYSSKRKKTKPFAPKITSPKTSSLSSSISTPEATPAALSEMPSTTTMSSLLSDAMSSSTSPSISLITSALAISPPISEELTPSESPLSSCSSGSIGSLSSPAISSTSKPVGPSLSSAAATVASSKSSSSSSSTRNPSATASTHVSPFYIFADRVNAWLETPRAAVAQPSYAHLPPEVKKIMIWRHAFPRMIDYFVGTPYSFDTTWPNPKTGREDPICHILAEIDWIDKSGKKQRALGRFEYSIDGDNICYHRYFQYLNKEEVVNFLSIKKESDFPSLETSHRLLAEKAKEIEVHVPEAEGSYTKGPLGTVIIHDRDNDFTITLFKRGL